MSLLTDEEFAYFSNVISSGNDGARNSFLGHSLSVETEVPPIVADLLGDPQLTLLAEISYYRLFFPLELKTGSIGILSPTLGTPEVIDMRGVQRSWRLNKVKDIRLVDKLSQKEIEVLSLSSSGMTIKEAQEFDPQTEHNKEHLSQLILPNGTQLDMTYEEVRTENDVTAIKINAGVESREVLREFLFNEHKKKYRHLYKGLNGEWIE